MKDSSNAHFHLPGLFEFIDFYKVFLPLFFEHREFFYEWCDISSIYGAPSDALWGGGRVGFGKSGIEKDVLNLSREFGFSVRLTFSNLLLEEKHLDDSKCMKLCELFHDKNNGIIISSDLLLDHIKKNFPDFYFVSSTTKVLDEFTSFESEIERDEFKFVVPDFRLNTDIKSLEKLSQQKKDKVEFLCNECCWFGCRDRRSCYENVSKKALGIPCKDWVCKSPGSERGYLFSKAMKNPGFIGIGKIRNQFMPIGFSNFKIEGRSLGNALLLEFILHYMVKPEFQINVREEIYLDNSLDLF